MLSQQIAISGGSVACVMIFAGTLAGQSPSVEGITSSQARAMIDRFVSSFEGARLGLRRLVDDRSVYGKAFVDPHNGLIRSNGWWIDPVMKTVLLPSRESQIEGAFRKQGSEYVIVGAREVSISRIRPDEAKVMVLKYLSSEHAGKIPRWVTESRKLVEASNPRWPIYPKEIRVGPWKVNPYVGTVLLPGERAELAGTFRRDGASYVVKDVVLREVHRIKPAEAKAMVLRFLATEEAGKLIDLTNTREVVEQSDPSVRTTTGVIYVGPWTVDPFTQEFRLSMKYRVYVGVVAKEADINSMFLMGHLSIGRSEIENR